MHFNKILLVIILLLAGTLMFGCSGGQTPITTDYSSELPNANLTNSDSMPGALGLLGAYKLTINSDSMTPELVPARQSSIGEDFIVNGINYFIEQPCAHCFTMKGFSATREGNLRVRFLIEHPFDPGIPTEPPTAKNRLDLDIFDLALIVYPDGGTSTNYPLTQANAYTGLCNNADGYTTELATFKTDPAAVPYFLIIDDSDTGISTWNKFGMGYSETFFAEFVLSSVDPVFNLYLTFGYGMSATYLTRFEPKYFNPEFNRKAAWKVEVTPYGQWIENITHIAITTEVKVYDWQAGATVYSDPADFANAPVDNIYASSEVESVSVEIPGMNSVLTSITTPAGGTGIPSDPLIYNFSILNQNNLAAGDYTGLVKVTDERPCLDIVDNRDFLVDSTDGVILEYHTMPEYATYQTFPATVAGSCTGFCWAKTWGGSSNDHSNSVANDEWGNVYVVGTFRDTVDFDPGPNVDEHTVTGYSDGFLSKFSPNGDWQWTKTWGGTDYAPPQSIVIDEANDIYVGGYFSETVDFNPEGGGTEVVNGGYDSYISKFDPQGNWQWTQTWGGPAYDELSSMSCDNSGSIYAVGSFEETCEFNPAGGDPQTSNGSEDSFLSKFNSNGVWQWSKTWGGTTIDTVNDVANDSTGNVYAVGHFNGTPDFDPDGGAPQTSHGGIDAFMTKFDSSGNWQWAKIWGGLDYVNCKIITIDDADNVYVGGNYQGTSDFNPLGGGTYSSHGGTDPYLSKFGLSGNWLFTASWGGPDTVHADAIAVDPAGSIYVGGYYRNTCDFNPAGGGTQTSNGEQDAYVNKFDSGGAWISVKTWGGPEWDAISALSADYAGHIYIVDYFEEVVDFNPDGGDWHVSNGLTDAYLSKMLF